MNGVLLSVSVTRTIRVDMWSGCTTMLVAACKIHGYVVFPLSSVVCACVSMVIRLEEPRSHRGMMHLEVHRDDLFIQFLNQLVYNLTVGRFSFKDIAIHRTEQNSRGRDSYMGTDATIPNIQ